MEIFRTDGSGADYANQRLFNLVLKVSQNTYDGFLDNINVIKDHKGTLMIYLKEGIKDYKYYYSVFNTFWYLENEYLVEVYVGDELKQSTL